jgi:hypothetical protein
LNILRLRHRKALFVGIGSVLAIIGALVLVASTLASAHGDLLTILAVVTFVLAALLGTVLGLGLVVALVGVPVLAFAGAARLLGKAFRRNKGNAASNSAR